jgi:O-antigen ligase
MNQTIALNKPRQPFLYIFAAFWSLLILANFVPAIPQPAAIIGYLWKTEFVLAAFLLVAVALLLKFPKEKFVRFSRNEFFLVIAPLLLFTTWSGLSVFWADAPRAAIHHTLLWACYCVFYVLMRQLAANAATLDVSFKIAGLVIFILGFACIAEFVSNPEQISAYFTYRYYKYAEVSATLLPVFLALVLRQKSRASLFAGAVAVVAWLIVLLSGSRTLFISGFVAVGLFFALVFLFQNWKKHLKKSALLFAALALGLVVSQVNFSPSPEGSTVKRFTVSEASQASFNSRFLFWGVALEAFKQNPFAGVGADNFISAYRQARENYSSLDAENKLLEINEDVLAERPHNEYLQILSELGIVGAIIFAWLLGGIVYAFFSLRRNRASLLSIAAFAGIVAFLISSLASSYSFRVPANGLCFLFLLAIIAKNFKFQISNFKLESKNLKPIFVAFGLVICFAMLAFSAVRGASLMYLKFAVNSSEEVQAEQYYRKAIALDDEDGSFKYYYGLMLFNRGRADEAIPQMRAAIDKGVATSISYFYLASANAIVRKPVEAEKAFAESLRVYPRSIFLRTAYASFLKVNGEIAASEVEFEKALRVNESQAKSWMTAHEAGMGKLTQIESENKNFIKPMELKPAEGIYALLDFQRQFNPNLVRR